MKRLKLISKILLCTFGALIFVFGARIGYICAKIPDNVFVMEGENYNFDKYGVLSGLFSINSPAARGGEVNSDGVVDTNNMSTVSLFGIDIKSVNVNTIPKNSLVPCGNSIGVKIYSGGIVVVQKTPFETQNGKISNPCEKLDIKSGDIIVEANGKKVENIYDFCEIVENCGGSGVNILFKRNEKHYTQTIIPDIENTSGKYKVGLIVRDSIAGIGTLTYYCPADNTFGALGHGIEGDGVLFPAQSGSIENAKIINVVKGRRGMPGEMHGAFAGGEVLGNVTKNTDCGIFGTSDGTFCDLQNAIPIATKSEVTEGSAYILSTVEDQNTRQYDAAIEKILHYGSGGSKAMIIHITDAELLAKTGGIIQGMSGSPLIQNGKLIGAVTHVFVNDPTRGYGIFTENMLAEAEKIK